MPFDKETMKKAKALVFLENAYMEKYGIVLTDKTYKEETANACETVICEIRAPGCSTVLYEVTYAWERGHWNYRGHCDFFEPQKVG